MLVLGFSNSCAGPNWNAQQPSELYIVPESNLPQVLDPEPEDIAFFKAIAEEQEKQLGLCRDQDACRVSHFLRGLTALYENRELAALHFRKVVVSQPSSLFARESRFWLWFLDVLNTPNSAGLSSHELIKRLTREVVWKELSVYELSKKLEKAMVEIQQKEVATQDEVVEKQKQAMATMSKQLEQAKKDLVSRQEIQQALEASEKKVEELTKQLEALRRIDQEIREKVPPTRPSEELTPSSEIEPSFEDQETTLPEGKEE